MLILPNTTNVIRVALTTAQTTTPMRCVASWRDIDGTTFTPGATLANTSGTTPVNIVAAPASGFQRVVDFISILNTDSVTKDITVSFWDGATDFFMARIPLAVNQRLEYSEGRGWAKFAADGSLITIIGGSTSGPVSTGWSSTVLGADVVNNNAVANTIQDITGLSFAVVNGQRYNFRFFINYTAAATTTGSRFSINGPAATALRYRSEYSLTTTSRTFNEGLSAYDTPAASNATSAATGSNIAVVEGFILPSADGTVIARFASEVASSAITAIRGSMVEFIAV